ncbi:MAG: NUDIX domain-containing protein [Patescibacteria group bacterium]
MKNIIKLAGVLVFLDNQVLLVRHGEKAGHLNNTYGVPAGRIETGESTIDAAARELFEETSLKTVVENLIKVPTEYSAAIKRKDGSIKNYHLETFLCTSWNGELKANEETVPEWINIDEIEKLKLLPNVKKMVSDALKLKKNSL